MLTSSRKLITTENIQLLSLTALVSRTALVPLSPTAELLRQEVKVVAIITGTVENKRDGRDDGQDVLPLAWFFRTHHKQMSHVRLQMPVLYQSAKFGGASLLNIFAICCRCQRRQNAGFGLLA